MDREIDNAQSATDSDGHGHDDSRIGSDNGGENGAAAPVNVAQVTTNDPAVNGTPQQTSSSPEDGKVEATFVSTEGAKIVLPTGADVDTIMVRGDDLLLIQEDGSVIVIVDGAKFPPALVIGGIEVPAETLAQIISNAEPGVPTAGADVPESDGLNVPQEDAPVTATFTSSDGAKIVLPPGTSVDTIMVRGDNLILVQEDGSIIVILDGAKYPPTLLLGGIEIPSDSLAFIIKDAPEGVPTAGPSTTQATGDTGPEQVPSSGGDFSEFNGDIGNPFPIGPLLPPTALQFFVPQVKDEEPGFLDDNGAPAAPPDLIPTQTPGLSVGGIVEEEELQRSAPPRSPTQLSDGNEDINKDPNDPDADGLGELHNTTITFTGNAANGQSLQNLVQGGDQSISFSLLNVANAPVHDTTGASVRSQGDPVLYHLIDANHLIGYADEDGSSTFNGAQNPGTTNLGEGPDRIVFELEVLPNGDWTLTIYDQFDHASGLGENLLSLNLTPALVATDANGTVLTFTGNAFVIGVIDDVPILTDETESRTVDEDDIHTPWSHGTSPNDGSGDGSTTENSSGAAFVSGNLGHLVSIGADDVQGLEGQAVFGFKSNIIEQMQDLHLYSKQSVQPAAENGLELFYTTGTDGDWLVLRGFEPDPDVADRGTGLNPNLGDTGNIVFELRLNQVTGDYEFRLFDELMHELPPEGSEENFALRSGLTTIDALDFGSLITVTDYDGDSVGLDGAFTISVRDDVPEPEIHINPLGVVQHDETAGVQGPSLADLADSDTNSASVKARFATLETTQYVGNDPDVLGDTNGAVPGDGPIGYARSTLPVVLGDLLGIQTGADSPAASEVFTLAILNEESGLTLTDGGAIKLEVFNNNTPNDPSDDLILGRVNDPSSTFNGQVAFAIGIDSQGHVIVAQYLSLAHPVPGSSHDESIDLGGKIGAVLTITDSDGDTVSTQATDIGDHIRFDDDGPKVDVRDQVSSSERQQLQLQLDETLGTDRYNSGESSDGGPDDDTGKSLPLKIDVSANLTSADAIGSQETHVTGGLGALFAVTTNFGADGALPGNDPQSRVDTLSFDVRGTGQTNLVVTALDGTSLEGLSVAKRTVYLVEVGPNVVEGRIPGLDGVLGAGGDDFVAFRLTIENADDPANAQIQVEQFLAIDHDASEPAGQQAPESPSLFDEQIGMLLTGSSALRLVLETQITDGDGDTDSDSAFVTLIDKNGSFIAIDDDGPRVVAQSVGDVAPILVHDETQGVQSGTGGTNTNDQNDAAGNTLPGVLALFNAIAVKGVDPDASDDNSAIGFARSGAGNSGVTYTADYGTDGQHQTNPIVYALKIPGANGTVDSGLRTTDGHKIYLFQQPDGLIVGRVDSDNSGSAVATDPAAIAITIDPATGELFVAQYLSLFHEDAGDGTGGTHDEQVTLIDGAVQVTVTAFDGDSDHATSNGVGIGHLIAFQDDGPSVTVIAEATGDEFAALFKNLDESVQPDGPFNPDYDRYNSGETESGGGGINGGDDDVAGTPNDYNQTPTVSTTPTADQAIGRLTTGAGTLDDLFGFGTPNFGTDGPATSSSRVDTLSFQLSGASSQTTLAVTALDGTDLEGLLTPQRTIYLVKVSDTIIEGRVPGSDGVGDNDVVAFRMTLNDAGTPGSASITIDQFLPIDHGGTENPSLYDEQALLNMVGDGALALRLTSTVTDGDGDTATSTADVNLVTNETSILAFDDDGPSIDVAAGADAAVLLTTRDAFTDGDPTAQDVAVSTAAFGSVFSIASSAFGADGAGTAPSLSYALSLAVVAGSDSGLDSNGASIFLYDISGVITGSTATDVGDVDAANTIFTIAVDGTGVVTLTQFAEIDHAVEGVTTAPYDDQFATLADGLVNLTATATITDGDGDTATDSAVIDLGGNIRFADDGPSIDTAVNVTVLDDEGQTTAASAGPDAAGIIGGPPASDAPGDDAGAVTTVNGTFAINAGADGLAKIEIAAPTLNAIHINPVTGEGTPMAVTSTWAQSGVGGTLTGFIDLGTANGVYDAGVDDLVYTLDVQADGNYTFSLFAPLAHTLTDDPSTAPTPVEIEFEDNLSLVFDVTITDGDGDTDATTLTLNVDDDTPDVGPVAGGEVGNGAGSVTSSSLNFLPGADGWSAVAFSGTPPVGLTAGGQPIQYFTDPATGTLTGYVGPLAPDQAGYDSANSIFTVSASLTTETGSYTFTLLQPIDGETEIHTITGSTAFGAGPAEAQVLENAGGTELSVISGWDVPGGFNVATWQSTGVAAGLTANDVNGSTAGWGVDNNNFDTGEFLRFDFGAADDYGNQDGYVSPSFDGPNISQTTFEFKNLGSDDTIQYVVHFVDGTLATGSFTGDDLGVNDEISFPSSGSKFIAFIELYAESSDGGVKVDLASVAVVTETVDQTLDFTVKVTDGDGDMDTAGFSVHVFDDAPDAALELTGAAVTHDETAGLQDGTVPSTDTGGDNNDNDVAGSTLPSAILTAFNGISDKGTDGDVSPLDNGAIGFAQSGSPVVADFSAPGGSPIVSTVFALAIDGGDETSSGLTTTEGDTILLFKEGDLIVGRVDGGANDGKAAFAIAIDQSGNIYLAQYLSLQHGEFPNNFDEAVSPDHILAAVTVTDSDGDPSTATVDISSQVKFEDDGPLLVANAHVDAVVDEDGLAEANLDAGRPGEVTGTGSATASGGPGALNALVNFGSDGAHPTEAFSLKVQSSPVDSSFDSKGESILIVSDGTTLHGYVELGAPGSGFNSSVDREVFSFTVGSAGSYSFTLKDQIDHPALDGGLGDGLGDNAENLLGTPLDLSAYIVAKDGDGDTVPLGTGAFTVNVQDDIPVVNQVQTLSFDDLLNNGNPFTDGQERGLNTIAPAGYGGFTWAQTGIFNPDPDGNSNPGLANLNYAVHSETNLAFFGEATGGDAGPEYPGVGGSPIVIQQTDGSNFGFLGAWFSSVNVDGLVISVTGYDDDNNIVGFDTIAVNKGGPIFFDFTGDSSNPVVFGSFANIDRLEFDADNFFGFDNFTFVKNPSYTTNNIPVIIVDEDDLPAGVGNTTSFGDDQPLHTSGTLGFLVGADEPAKVDFASMTGTVVDSTGATAVKAGGVALTYFWDASTSTLYATTDPAADLSPGEVQAAIDAAAFKIQITNTQSGAYTFTLLKAIDHPAPLPPADPAEYKGENNLDIKLVYTVTDADGDSATGNLFVSIDDDTPVASVALDGNPTFVLDETIGGADTPLDDTNSTPFAGYGQAIGVVTGAAPVFTNGAAYGADGPGTTTYALTAANGAAFNGLDSGIEITNGNTIYLYTEGGLVVGREGTLTDPNPGGNVAFIIGLEPGGAIKVAQYLAIDHGDGAGAEDATPGPDESAFLANVVHVTQTVTDGDGDVSTDTSDTAITVEFQDDGPSAAGYQPSESPDGFAYNPINAHFYVFVPDSVVFSWQQAVDAAENMGGYLATVTSQQENNFVLPLMGTQSGAWLGGSDAETDGVWKWVTGPEAGTVFWNGGPGGSAPPGQFANWSGGEPSANNPVINDVPIPENSLHFARPLFGLDPTKWNDINDADNFPGGENFVTGYIVEIGGRQGDPFANLLVQLDDDDVAGFNGIAGGVGDDASPFNVQGTLIHNYGTDGAGTTLLVGVQGLVALGAGTGAEGEFTYVLSDGNKALTIHQVQSGADVSVLTIALADNVSGDYTVTHLAPIDHPAGGDENNVNFVIGYQVTDGDGDTANGTFAINVDDDTPVVDVTGSTSIDEGAAGNGNWTLTPGADGFGLVQVTVGLETKTLSMSSSANTVTFGAVEGVAFGTLTVKADGTWTFASNAVASNQSLDFTVKVTDGDGDVATDTHTIQVLNVNQPLEITGSIVATVEEEDGLPGGIEDVTGNVLDTDPSPAVTNVASGNFSSVVGPTGIDGVLSFAFAPLVGNPAVMTATPTTPLFAGGKQVYFATESGNLIGYVNVNGDASAYNAGTDTKIFTVTLNSSGAYTFTLNAPVDHPINAPATEDSIAINLNGTVTVTDSGGPAADTNVPLTFTINVIDDIPVAPTLSAGAAVAIDETQGVQTAPDPNAAQDVPGTAPGFGSFATVAAIFADIVGKGIDADVSGVPGYAAGAGALVTPSGGGFGADGGAASYKLVIPNDGVASGVSTTEGTQIFLYQGTGDASHLILGRVGNELVGGDTANSSGTVAFALALDPATGKLVMAQYLSLSHPTDGSSYDEPVPLTATALQVQVTYTDGDGDKASSSLNVGNLVQFQDDGPTAGFTLTNASVTHDETTGLQGAPAQDQAAALPIATASGAGTLLGWAQGAGSVATDTSLGGADGKASVTYALTQAGGTAFTGQDSGLLATGTSAHIFLYTEGGLVVGREGMGGGGTTPNPAGAVAFSLGLGASNQLVLAQYEAIKHPTTMDPNDAQSITPSSLVHVTQTVTDGDGDTAKTTSAGSVTVTINDDGPSAALTSNGAILSHDETAGVQDTDLATLPSFPAVSNIGDDPHVTGTGAIGFATGPMFTLSTENYGADGAATSAAKVFALTLPNGSASGLLTTEGIAINLTLESGVVVGRVASGVDAGKAAIAIAIDSTTGQVSVAQYLSIQHPTQATAGNSFNSYDEAKALQANAVGVQVTLKDGDGDTTTANLDISSRIQFQDDGPLAVADTNSAPEGTKPTLNAILVIDLSLSMGTANPNPAPGFATRLDLLQAAVQNLLSSSDVIYKDIFIYTFNDGGHFEARFTMNTAGAITEVNSYVQSDLVAATEYDSTAADVAASFNALVAGTPLAAADQTVLYFLTDGDPTGGSSLDPGAEQTGWLNFLNGNGIDEVVAVGFGGIGSTAFLNPMAPRAGDVALAITNPADLEATLEGTLPGSADGNILLGTDNVVGGGDDDSFGADGGFIKSIAVNGTTYSWNGVTGASSVITLTGATTGTITGATSISVNTALGGHLDFYFAAGSGHVAGDYSYTAPSNVAADTPETFNYVIQDGDGDQATSSLQVTVINVPEPPHLALDSTQEVTLNVRDEFATQAYTNNGPGNTANWAGPWTETTDGGSATAGTIQITSGQLRFGDNSNSESGAFSSIERAVDLSNATSATLTFSYSENASAPNETLVVEAWNGSAWQNLTTIAGDGAGSGNLSFNLTAAQIGAFSKIRFSVSDELDSGEFYNIDNVNIAYQTTQIATQGGNTATYTEGGAAAAIATADSLITDPDSANMTSGKVVLTNKQAGDQFLVSGVAVANGSSGNIGAVHYAVVDNGSTITINLSNVASKAAYETAIEAITYSNTSNNPATVDRVVNVTVNDGTSNSNTAVATIHVIAVNDPPSISALSVTESSITFTITDTDSASLSLAAPFAAAFSNPILVPGVNVLTPTQQGSAVSGTLQVTDGTTSANVAGLYLGTSGGNSFTAGSSSTAIYGFGGTDTLTGGSAPDWIFGGSGNDTIVGAQNDFLLDGGTNTDTLQVGANFTSTSDAQIVNIENVTLTAAVTLNLANQTEGFTITGSSGNDTITGGSGADSISAGGGDDVINGAQNDTLLDGGANTDTLQIGANFTSSSNGQIVNIENIVLTAPVTLNLSNQTEGFTITGSAGADSITAGSGNDIIIGAQNDTLLSGGGGTDTLQIGANFTSTGDGQIVGIEKVALTASGLTLNLINQTEGFTIFGSSGVDTIIGGSGADIIVGGAGADNLTGGGGADQFRLQTDGGVNKIADFTAGTDKIAFLGGAVTGGFTFGNTAGNAAGQTLNATDFTTRSSISGIQSASDDNQVILITGSQTAAQITGDNGSGSGTPDNLYVVVFNSTTGRGEIWFDTNWETTAGRVQVATLDNVTTLAQLNAITASDIVVYTSTADPLVLDLGHAGIDFSSLGDGVQFDINADGLLDQIAWTSGDDGILAYDLDGSGKIDNGSELFTPGFAGGVYADGLAALASLDSNHDGMIDAQDAAFANLSVWIDANHDGVTDAGELKSLAQLGIAGIDLGAAGSNAFINGQAILAEGSFIYADGSTGSFVEVDFDAALGNTEAANDDAYDDGLDAEHEADNRATAANAAALAASIGFGVATAAASAVAADPLHLDDAGTAVATDDSGANAAASGLPETGPDGDAPVVDPLHGTPGDETTSDSGSTGSEPAPAQGLAPVDSDATPSPIESLAAAPADSDDHPATITTPDGQPAHPEAASNHQFLPSSGAAFEESKAEPLPEVKSLVDQDATVTTPVAAALHASLADRLAALSALDSNHDGLIDANDANFSQLTVWQDANHDGVADADELSSLADHGIDGIALNGISIEGYLDAQSLLAQPASGEPLVAMQGSDAQFAKLASLDFGDLLVGADHYLDLDQALKDSPLTGSSSEGASASGPAASEAQPGASSAEAAQLQADAPAPSVDSGAAQGSSGTPAQQTPSQSQAAQANDGPAEAAGPNHVEAAAVTIHVDDGAEQAQNHAVA